MPKNIYKELVEQVKTYIDKKHKNGALFVGKYDKWLHVYGGTFDDLKKDKRFKEEVSKF